MDIEGFPVRRERIVDADRNPEDRVTREARQGFYKVDGAAPGHMPVSGNPIALPVGDMHHAMIERHFYPLAHFPRNKSCELFLPEGGAQDGVQGICRVMRSDWCTNGPASR